MASTHIIKVPRKKYNIPHYYPAVSFRIKSHEIKLFSKIASIRINVRGITKFNIVLQVKDSPEKKGFKPY